MDVRSDDASDKLSDSSDDEEAASLLTAKVAHLSEKLTDNPLDYDAHVELISTLRSVFDLDQLRVARKRMADLFPLTSNLWMEWLEDEIKIATSLEEKQSIVQLFEQAVKDYLSVDIWLEYAQFSIGLQAENNEAGVDNVRNVFERALTAAGLHVTKGSLLWAAYVEFEVVVLSLLQSKQESPEVLEAQLKRIANLFRRQLSCPLLDMDDTFDLFQMWLDDSVKADAKIIDKTMVEAVFKKSKEKLSRIGNYEETLLLDSTNYGEYLNYEKSKEGSPSRVLCLYERLVCEQCLNPALWNEYIQYIDTVLQDGKLAIDVTCRAIRNCPWSGLLAVAWIRLLEKYEAAHSEINDAIEQTLAPGTKSPTDVRDIWMCYLEYMRRRFDAPEISKEEESKRLQELEASFEKALEHVNALEGTDSECLIAQYGARIAAKCAKNLEKFRQIWSDIVADPQRRTAAMWLEYITLEMAYGDSKHLRKLFPRALQQTTDWPESIYSSWLNYERDEGTFESYANCVAKCTARIAQIQKQRDEAERKEEEKRSAYQDNRRSKRAGLGYQKNEQKQEGKREPIRKRQSVENHQSSPEKKPKIEGTTTQNIVDELLNESKHGTSVKHDSSKDNRTVFVSNLDFDTSEETLRSIFEQDGTITDLRLVKDFKGRSKGYSYVEYQNTELASRALKRDRQLIEGRPMYVSRCDPDKETRSAVFRFSTSVEKNKLFVRGLPFSTTEADLLELFGKYGAVKSARLVVFRNGHSKGLAYVDFHDEVSATQAILKADGMKIGDKEISVAISNPPTRQKQDTASTVSSLGGGKKETGPRGRGRTQISFLPRSLTVNPTTKGIEKMSLDSPQPQYDVGA